MWFLQVFTLHFSDPSQGQGFFSIPAHLTIYITRSFAKSVEFGQIMLPFLQDQDHASVFFQSWPLPWWGHIANTFHPVASFKCTNAPMQMRQRIKTLSLSQPVLQFQTAIPLSVPQFNISPTAQNPCPLNILKPTANNTSVNIVLWNVSSWY